MTTFDAGVWVTQAQYNDTGWGVRDRAVTYLEDSGQNINHSLNVVGKTRTPDAPEECPLSSFTATYPCDSSFLLTYDNLNQWWGDYLSCNSVDTEADSNLLVSDCVGAAGGGRADGSTAVANGNHIENLPSFGTPYENGDAAYSMSAVIHEVGHCLMDYNTDSDNDGHDEHDTCGTPTHNSDVYTTPMGAGYWYNADDTLSGDNECDDSTEQPNDDDWVEFYYHECAGSKM